MQVALSSFGSLCSLVCAVLLLQIAFLVVCTSETESGLGSGFFSDGSGGSASGSGYSESDDATSATPTTSPATNGSGPGSVYGTVCVVM